MAMKFQVRGTQADAYYASAWKTAAPINTGGYTVGAGGVGCFGSSVIDITNGGSNNGGIQWVGLDNMSLNGAISILMRIVPNFTGNPAATVGLLEIAPGDGNNFGGLMFRCGTDGKLIMLMKKTDSTSIMNVNPASACTFTSGTAMDIWFTWDGTTSANKIKFYSCQNGNTAASVGTATDSVAMGAASRLITTVPSIIAGPNPFANNGAKYTINEIVIFDTEVDPTSYGARTDFIAASAFEGYVSTGAGASNIKAGVTEVINGLTITGTLATGGGGKNHLGPGRAG